MNINEIMSRAIFYYNSEDLDKSLHFLNKILNEDPSNSKAKELLAKVKKRISLEPYINHFLEYATKLSKEGRNKEAIEQAQKAVSTDPDSKKAKLFLEKLKNQVSDPDNIEPFAEDNFVDEIDDPDMDSPFLFDEEGTDRQNGKKDITENIMEQNSIFDQPFSITDETEVLDDKKNAKSEIVPGPSKQNQKANSDDFVFSLETDKDQDNDDPEEDFSFDLPQEPIIIDTKENIDPVQKQPKPVQDNQPFKEMDGQSKPDHVPGFGTPLKHQQPDPEETLDSFEHNTDSDKGKTAFSNEDFDFSSNGFSVPESKEKDQDFAEDDLFDFEAENTAQKDETKMDMDFEEAEIGFFTQKENNQEQTQDTFSHPPLKSKTINSETLLNDFQKGLLTYKELNLNEALDIFTGILSHEKEYMNELPDLFEESRQLFLEIKSKLKNGDSKVSNTNEEVGIETFEEPVIKTDISIKTKPRTTSIGLYTIISLIVLIIVFAGFYFLTNIGRTHDMPERPDDSFASEQQRQLLLQERQEKLARLTADAKQSLEEGKIKEAQSFIEEIFDIDPDNFIALELENRILFDDHMEKGRTALAIQNHKLAYEHFRAAYAIDPEGADDLQDKMEHSQNEYYNNQALYGRMERYHQEQATGDVHSAYRMLSIIKGDYPSSKYVQHEYNIISEKKRIIDEQIRQEKIQEYMTKARIHFNNRLYDLAIAEYRKALELDPKNSVILEMLYKSFYNTGIVALRRRNTSTAFWAFNEALKIYPNDQDSTRLADFSLDNLERITTPNYTDFVNSLIIKE